MLEWLQEIPSPVWLLISIAIFPIFIYLGLVVILDNCDKSRIKGKRMVGNIFFIVLCVYSALLTTFLLFRMYPRDVHVGFDYMGVIVGVLSIMVTILITWNIYNIIDLKRYEETFEKLNNSIHFQIDRLDGKANYNQGVSMGYMAQMLAGKFINDEENSLLFQMLCQCAGSLKILSKEDAFVECNSILNTVIEATKNTKVVLSKEETDQLLILFSEIQNAERIDNLPKIIRFLVVME